jgi:hypothetical protein
VVCGDDWINLDAQDDKLMIATTRILRLKAAGLTIEMIGSDFLRRRITPLQNKGRSAWEFQNAADIMRLRPGLNNNLIIMQLATLRHKLFQRDDKHRLPARIIPLCNNSALGSIIATMPMFNAHGLDATWVEPSEEQAQTFFDNLSERAVREETGLVHATTDEEVAYIATRVEEAKLATEAGDVGFTEWETSDAEVILEEDPAREDKAAGEQSSTAAENSSDEDTAEEQPQEEPPAPKRAKRVLRKAISDAPANQPSSSSDAPGKKAAGKVVPRQGV